MERSIIVLMMKIIKNSYFYFILLIIILNHSTFINIITNFSKIATNNDNIDIAELNILKDENAYLKEELNKISSLSSYANYNYKISRLSYRDPKNRSIFYINGGKNEDFKIGYALVNNEGLVGLITEVYDSYSKCSTIDNIDISISINNIYGTITKNDDIYLISNNFSNKDDINLNDIVYTSELGIIKESIKIGTVKKIDNSDISKTIYIEPFVDFNNISYLYVIGG